MRSGFVSRMQPRTCSKLATSRGRWLLRWQRRTESASESPSSRWSAPFSSSLLSWASSCARCRPTKPATPVMSVRKELASPPGLQEILERGLERNDGLPPGRLLESPGVPEQDGHVRGTHAGRVLLHLHLGLREAEEVIQHRADGPVLARADVVDLAGLALLEREPVGPHHVAHVGEIAAGLEIADPDHRRAATLLDVGDLLREIRADEHRAAARALVVEAARSDDRQLEAHEVLIAQHVLAHLAHRVGGEGAQRIGLADGELVLVDHAVLLARARELDPRHDVELLHGLEDVQLADD